MARPWEVSADDIVNWANTISAAATLPKLVRRLLFATAPLRTLAMRADAGTRLAGWDGVVESFRSTKFCPSGLSYWELSVAADVKSKLDRDFQKRLEEHWARPSALPSAVYVAVTARRFPDPSRSRWLLEKRRLGVFAEIVVRDADDLATWIEQAPPVARWFAELLGKPATGADDLEIFLARWEARTAPPLPSALAVAGREREASAERVRTWLKATAPQPLAIRGDTREEALVFAAAAITNSVASDFEPWYSRALVVRDLETWRWLLGTQHAEPPILLPAFPEIDRGHAEQAARALNAHVILPLDASAPVDTEAELLEPISYAWIARQLQRAGMAEAEAERVARESGGRLAALQRLLGHVVAPDWLASADLPALLVMLLAGAWDPTSDADREVLRRLGGDPAKVEELCVRLSTRPDAPIERETSWGQQGHWKWIAPADAWRALARHLSDSNLTSFRDVAIEILSERDPRYDMPRQERFYAAAYGKVLGRSAALRAGIAESLIRLSLSDPELRTTHQISRGSQLAEFVVSRVLDDALGWQAWASLSDLLPVLAEAAPSTFLSQVERSLDRGEAGVSHLLLEEEDLGSSPHTGLLWALETLGWKQDLMPRVAYALARLALHDPPASKMANRPARSLSNLLHPLIPQSQSSVDERIQILSALLQRRELYGEVGWSVALEQYIAGPGIMHSSHRPQYQSWGAPAGRLDAAPKEVEAQRARTLELLLQHVDSEPVRWTALLDSIWRFEPAVAARMLDQLGRTMSASQDVGGGVWASLRQLAARGYQFREAWNVPSNLLERVVELYLSFTPTDEIERISWLFDNQAQVPEPVGDWQAQRTRKLELQQIETAKLWRTDNRWELLARLTTAADHKYAVGYALGAIAESELDERLLRGPKDERLSPLLPGFVWRRAQTSGTESATRTIKELVDAGRRDDALAIALIRADDTAIWDTADAIGEPFREELWSKVDWLPGEYSKDDADRAIRSLLATRNVVSAVRFAAHNTDAVAPSRALELLEAFRRVDDPRLDQFLREGGAAYDIGRIFTIVDRDTSIAPEIVASLELHYFPLLEGHGSPRGARHLFAALSRNPDLFVELIVACYKPEHPTATEEKEGDGVPPAAPATTASDEQVRKQLRARVAYEILSEWRGYPGDELPPEQWERGLLDWALKVLQGSTERDRKSMGEREVAKVLARAPRAPLDGIWPCRAAREFLESGRYGAFENGLLIAKVNLRGGTSRALGEGGEQERTLAAQFRTDAGKLRIQWPRTGALLDKLADRYAREAELEDAEASSDRRRWGSAPPDDSTRSDAIDASESPKAIHFDRIDALSFVGVGPAPSLKVQLAPQLTLLTGQNSAGKTFILEVLWWALTGTWADLFAWPRRDTGEGLEPTISIGLPGRSAVACRYSPNDESWSRSAGLGSVQALVIYCRVDGGFAVWDPVRGRETASGKKTGQSRSSETIAFNFTPNVLWEHGLKTEDGEVLCNGIIHDVVDWKARQPELAKLLDGMLSTLSAPDEPMRLAEPQRLWIRDPRDFPTLHMPYGDIPIVYASAAVKRIFGLAYLLVWAWHEHHVAARLVGADPVGQMVVLFDEPEAHLHPIWQRRVLPALFEAVRVLSKDLPVQIVASTHSPLVTASLETRFNPATDKLLHFVVDDADRAAKVHELTWAKQGDASDWLVSEVFGLKQARSAEAEAAIVAAMDFVKNGAATDPSTKAEITNQLRSVLASDDPFMIRWNSVLAPEVDPQ